MESFGSWEIDIIQFCKRLIAQWRAVILFGFVFSGLVFAASFAGDRKDSYTSISDEELKSVYEAIDNQKEIDYLQEYIKDNTYYNINPLDERVIHVLYRIKSNENVHQVAKALEEYCTSDSGLNIFAREVSWESDKKYLGELISIKEQSSDVNYISTDNPNNEDVLVVSLLVPVREDEEIFADALCNLVTTATDVVTNDYGYQFDIKQYDIIKKTVVDRELQLWKKEVQSQLIDCKNNQNALLKSFSNIQKYYYDSLLNGENIANVLYTETTNNRFYIKKSLLGFLVGVLMYILGYFLFVWYSPYVEETFACYISGLESIGWINLRNAKKTAIKSYLFDKKFWYFLNKHQEDKYFGTENVIERLRVYSENADANHIQLLMLGYDASEEKEIVELKETAKKMDILLELIPVNQNRVSIVVSQLKSDVSIALVVCEQKTLKSDLQEMISVLEARKIKISGMINLVE